MWLYSHDSASEGAKELSTALGIKRISHENSRFVGKADKVVINWGASELPVEVGKCRVINTPDSVLVNSNKLSFFNTMGEYCRVVPWTSSARKVLDWLGEGSVVVARTVLRGSSGNGIRFIENPEQLVNAQLYTKYIPKKHEYRVHFVGDQIIDFQRKALREGIDKDSVNWRVRNLENGFVFVRGNVVLPEDVREQAQLCIDNSTLDFGAIDLIYNEKSGLAYVLEVNTAPGLVGSTTESYATALREYIR